jgi:hypothetical protein
MRGSFIEIQSELLSCLTKLEKLSRVKGGGVPDDEAAAGVAPGDGPVQLRLADQLRALRQRLQRMRRLRQRERRLDEVVVVVQRDVVGPLGRR